MSGDAGVPHSDLISPVPTSLTSSPPIYAITEEQQKWAAETMWSPLLPPFLLNRDRKPPCISKSTDTGKRKALRRPDLGGGPREPYLALLEHFLCSGLVALHVGNLLAQAGDALLQLLDAAPQLLVLLLQSLHVHFSPVLALLRRAAPTGQDLDVLLKTRSGGTREPPSRGCPRLQARLAFIKNPRRARPRAQPGIDMLEPGGQV